MRAVVLFVLVGCGRFGFDEIASDGNGVEAPRCLAWGPFGTPTRMTELSTAWDDWSPAFAAGDTIAFTSDWSSTNPAFAIGQRTRATASDPFSAIVRLPKPTGTEAMHPSPTPDGNTVYVTLRVGSASNIAVATRVDATTFTMPQNIASLVSIDYNHAPHISADQLRLYYATNHLISTDGGSFELAFTSRPDTQSQFAPPQLMTDLESTVADTNPTLSRDELEIFFASERAGGLGSLDIYRATRNAITDPFTNIQAVTVLNSTRDDTGPELSADGSILYYNRDTDITGGQNSDVWYASRTCLMTAP